MTGLPWKRNEDGKYQRQTDDVEHLMGMTAANAGSMFHLCVSTKVAFADATNLDHRLRQAWKRFGVKNPYVTATWKAGDKINSSIVATPLDTEEKLEQWANETFAVDDESENGDQLARHAPKDKRGLLTWVSRSRQLVLELPHWACDAFGAGYAFTEILTAASKRLGPPADLTMDESSLVPTSLDGFGLPAEKLEWKDVSHTPAAQDALAQLLGAVDCARVPTITSDQTNPTSGFDGAMACYDLELTEDETARAVARAKELGVTMGMYVFAAAAKTMQDYDHRPQAKYGCVAAFNRRPYFDKLRWDRPLGEFGVLWPMSVAIHDKSFPEILDQVRAYLARNTPFFRGEKDEGFHPTRVAGAGKRAFMEAMAQASNLDAKPALWGLSSLGVFDPYLPHQYGQGADEILVEDWKVTSRGTTAGTSVVVHTWRGKLRLNAFWNEVFHDREAMTHLVDKFKDTILTS